MATPSNKPRDIKNLKARLGRTITPGQTGTPGGFPGTPGPVSGSVPPPVVGGGFPGVPTGAVQPGVPGAPFGRPGAPNPGARSPLASPSGAPGQTPGQLPGQSTPAARQGFPGAPAAHAAPSARSHAPGQVGGQRVDPFAAAPATAVGGKRVTLVIDDSAVKDDEIGRKSRGRAIALVTTGALLGLAIGFGIGNTTDKRHQYKAAVEDGKAIYARIQAVSKTVESARDLIKRAVDASSGGPGKKAGVDFDAVEQLVAFKRPFSANEFHRRLYRAFGDGVVDDLFDYYNDVNLLWDGFTGMGAKTTGAARRDALQKSAAATDGLLNTDYGMVLTKNGEQLAGGLVFLNMVPPPAGDAAAAKPDKHAGKKKGGKDAADEGIKVKVSSIQGGQEVERTLFTGQNDVGEKFEKYAFVVDKVRSRTILGESANLFSKFRGDLMDLNARMDKTVEVQGRLIKGLGPIAAINE
jgi:hypothetical protein